MAKCGICGRSATTGNKRSHSNVATKRKFKINLQVKKINGKKQTICTKCIKGISKVK